MSGFALTVQNPVERGESLYTLEGALRSPGSSFPIRCTVIRSGRKLLLVSSFPPEPEVLEVLRQLGEVKLILAPNSIHCLWGAKMRDACPGVKLAGPPNAAKRFPQHNWDALVSNPDDLVVLLKEAGFKKDAIQAWTTSHGNPWMQEIVLLHKPSKTLIVTDLAFNFRPGGETPLPGGPLGVVFRNTYLPLAGGYRPCCPTKPFGILVKDPEAMCSVLSEVMKADFDQVIVAHGDVVKAPGGKKAFGEGTVAFFQEAAERQRAGRSSIYLAAGVVGLAAVALGCCRLVGK